MTDSQKKFWIIVLLIIILVVIIAVWIINNNLSAGVTSCRGHVPSKTLIDHDPKESLGFVPKMTLYNPSIAKYKDYYLVAVRESNSHINNIGHFIYFHLYPTKSHFHLYVYDKNFKLLRTQNMKCNYDPYVKHEDPRIFTHKGRIFTFVTEYRTHPGTVSSIYPILHEYSFDPKNLSFILIGEYQLVLDKSLSMTQKNWCAFEHQGKILVHTDSGPIWTVRELMLPDEKDEFSNSLNKVYSGTVNLKTIIEQDVSDFFNWQDYPSIRCSTSWIDFTNDTYLACLHTYFGVLRTYNTVFVEISKKTLLPVRKSHGLCFDEDHSRIQFTSGIEKNGDKVIVCYGINDIRFKIIEFDSKVIHNILDA